VGKRIDDELSSVFERFMRGFRESLLLPWELEARSQGYRFLGLCIEEGGRLGDGFKQFLDQKPWCIKHAASFRVFARNHIHITNLKAVTRVTQVNSRRSSSP